MVNGGRILVTAERICCQSGYACVREKDQREKVLIHVYVHKRIYRRPPFFFFLFSFLSFVFDTFLGGKGVCLPFQIIMNNNNNNNNSNK